MHRVTSADALSTSAGHVKSAHPIPVHDLLPYMSEALDRLDEPEQTGSDISDDVPLLQSRSANLSQKPTNIFEISPPDLQNSEKHTSTAWREASASLKLSAPITVQVLTNLTHFLPSLGTGEMLIHLSSAQALSQFSHILIIMSAVGRLGVNELAGIAVGWTVHIQLSIQLACVAAHIQRAPY